MTQWLILIEREEGVIIESFHSLSDTVEKAFASAARTMCRNGWGKTSRLLCAVSGKTLANADEAIKPNPDSEFQTCYCEDYPWEDILGADDDE